MNDLRELLRTHGICDWCDRWTPKDDLVWHCHTLWCPACNTTKQCACIRRDDTA
jgi:hypothetical protein